MPRSARKKADSGIYHIMLRGINRQQIFEDEEDNRIFLKILQEYKYKCDYKILAYCIMGNHIHLLLKEGNIPLSDVFKRIGVSFVYWYNVKYQRVGHLFQDRYRSEVVNNVGYLCNVIRYIHQNPVKAGMVNNPEDYPYSSLSEYIGEQHLVDMNYVENFVSKESVVSLSSVLMEEECMDMKEDSPKRITDEIARQILIDMTGCNNVTAFQSLKDVDQKECVLKLKTDGVSLRQICRLTGLTYYTVQKIK